jgi:hypothetical protein
MAFVTIACKSNGEKRAYRKIVKKALKRSDKCKKKENCKSKREKQASLGQKREGPYSPSRT